MFAGGGKSGVGAVFTAELRSFLSLAGNGDTKANELWMCAWLDIVGHVGFRHGSLTGLDGFATELYGVVSSGI